MIQIPFISHELFLCTSWRSCSQQLVRNNLETCSAKIKWQTTVLFSGSALYLKQLRDCNISISWQYKTRFHQQSPCRRRYWISEGIKQQQAWVLSSYCTRCKRSDPVVEVGTWKTRRVIISKALFAQLESNLEDGVSCLSAIARSALHPFHCLPSLFHESVRSLVCPFSVRTFECIRILLLSIPYVLSSHLSLNLFLFLVSVLFIFFLILLFFPMSFVFVILTSVPLPLSYFCFLLSPFHYFVFCHSNFVKFKFPELL